MQLLEDFAAIASLASADALHVAARRFIGDLEFERYELQLVTGGIDGDEEEWRTVGNVPDGFMPLWLGNGRGCPVMHHAKKSSQPLYWGEEVYRRADRMSKWETQRPWGYGTGFIVATHLRRDKHVVIAVERELPLRDSDTQLTYKCALFQLFATCALDACLAVMESTDASAAITQCLLSRRELEVLQWTLAGKTAWEVGAILGISQGTAAQYLSSASRKLGAVNKHQAALKALRLGWID